jgi:hypothetical protein
LKFVFSIPDRRADQNKEPDNVTFLLNDCDYSACSRAGIIAFHSLEKSFRRLIDSA